MTFGPSDRWYEPPEPIICCREGEDDPDHDPEACLADQAEAAAEERAERAREDAMFDRDDRAAPVGSPAAGRREGGPAPGERALLRAPTRPANARR